MNRRRWMAAAVSIGGVFAACAPAAQAAQETPLTFTGVGSVDVQDLGPASNTVRFTMHDMASPDTTRLFIDTHGLGRAYIALGNPAALGVAHAVYNDVSTDTCQVYSGRTFGEADETPGTAGTIVFDIRKDELAPTISLAMDNGSSAACTGFDGVSAGRTLDFATAGRTLATPLDWSQPGEAAGVRAEGTPNAITLFWTPPADALGVRYQVLEVAGDGTESVVSESVQGNAATISGLAAGSAHSYRLNAYRLWGGRWFAAAKSNIATAVATSAPAPAAAGAAATGAPAVKSATAKSGATKKAPARAFALKGFRVRATHGRVRITLPKLAKGQTIEILRSAATKKARFGRIATSKARSYTDRTVRRRHTYRYRLILVGKDGSRSLPSATLKVRVR
jgi:hypothetical protein